MSLNPDIAAFLQLVGNGRASGKRVGMHELSPTEARLTVTEGRYHMVRRMFAAVGNHVQALHRSRVGGLAA